MIVWWRHFLDAASILWSLVCICFNTLILYLYPLIYVYNNVFIVVFRPILYKVYIWEGSFNFYFASIYDGCTVTYRAVLGKIHDAI